MLLCVQGNVHMQETFLVCAQRCELCVHRRRVVFLHRGVRCVCAVTELLCVHRRSVLFLHRGVCYCACLFFLERCALCVHWRTVFVHRDVCCVCIGEVSWFCTEVCVVCACLVCFERCALCVHRRSVVFAQRCALCVHWRSVLFVRRGVRCVCTGELSCLCTEVCVMCAQEKCFVFCTEVCATCACLVCVVRCTLCVHRRSVMIVCAQRCVFLAFTANVISYSFFSRLWMPPLSPHCFHMGLIATARPPADFL